ncbi:1025_t:CDS:2 [Paraglomus brasilianum]|uniref:1025_t:CDS:1 n=1 Tax=Paraglomus brasilianum TaxID=144538 RepID=A0A9N8VL15_9GLOM|nr:1025_t:CDS:2 [Paraglomus brasilianum]
MDFFSKLKNKLTAPKAQPSHAEQLGRFNSSWNAVRSMLETPADDKDRKPVHVELIDIHKHLETMTDALCNESLSLEDQNTGLCMEEFLRNDILQKLVDLSEPDVPAGVRGEVLRTVAYMIEMLDDQFLVQRPVHEPTVKLLRTCVQDQQQSEKYHEDLVDLMYYICWKMKGFPDLLNIFFHDVHWLTTPQKAAPKSVLAHGVQTSISSSSSQDGNPDDGVSVASGSTTMTPLKTTEFTEEPEKPEYEFLLFSYLLQFVHREGRSGDFARTGLLFIMDLAQGQLGDFILESDFATIMSAGLGALYSQLPRKLMVKSSTGVLTSATLLGFGDNTSAEMDRARQNGIEVSSSLSFKVQLDSFCKLLEFCQDVLNRCPSVEISLALLQNIKSIFLENILYPSIMECSDTDGSAVAVISYIDMILQSIEQEELVDVIVGFLMDSDSDNEDFWKKKATSKAQKRQSTINLFAGVEASTITSSPYFTAVGRFTLKDLIFSRLKSSSQPTVIAALKLLHTMISKHCRYSLRLLSFEPDESATCFPKPHYLEEMRQTDFSVSPGVGGPQKLTTISHHSRELDLFFSLISITDPSNKLDVFTNGYENYVRDAEAIIEADLCYRKGQDLEWNEEGPSKPKVTNNTRQKILYSQRGAGKLSSTGISDVPRHRLNPTDRHNPSDSLLQILLGALANFFVNSPELNLALTGVISALAMCPYRSLEGWLVFSSVDRIDRGDRREAMAKDWDIDSDFNSFADRDDKPINGTLTKQVEYYRSMIDGFDEHLKKRRQGLLDTEDEIDENYFRQPIPINTPQPSRRMSNPAYPSSISTIVSSSFSSSPSRRGTTSSLPGRNQKMSSIHRADSAPPTQSSSNVTTTLGTHSRETESIKVQPLFPAHFVNDEEEEDVNELVDEDDEEGFSSKKSTRTKTKEIKPSEITLSALLNNIVILEEAIKELVAIIQVRRSLGIDEIKNPLLAVFNQATI